MAETDVTFRHLIRGLPRPILQLAFPRHQLEPLGPLDPSVDRTRPRTADSLFRVRDGNADAAVHVELERDWRPTIPPRLFECASGAAIATELPIGSVVVLLRPGGQPPSGTGAYTVQGIDGDTFVFRYHVVPLWQLDAHAMLAELGLIGSPYCVAMKGADEQFVRGLTEEVRTDCGLTDRDRASTTWLLYIVSAVIRGSDTARRIFHVESIIQDPNVQELIKEWEDKGREEGRAEGRTEGRAEGRTEGRAEGRTEGRAEGRTEGRAEGLADEARAMLHDVLEARSFAVTPDVRERIAQETDRARLEAWLRAAVTASSIGDVFRGG